MRRENIMTERGGKRANSAIVMIMALLLFFTAGMTASYAEEDTDSSIVEYNETIEGGSIYFDTFTGNVVDSDRTVISADIPGEIAGVKVEAIETGAFSECSLLTEVSLAPGIKLKQQAFTYCNALEAFTFADSATAKLNGLYKMQNLKKIIIPAGVAFISGVDSRETSRALLEYEVDVNNQSYCAINGALYDKNVNILYSVPMAANTDIFVVPDTVETIYRHAFEWCTEIKRINLPEGIETVGQSAFPFTEKLEEVNLPESLTALGGYAFFRSGIRRILIPERVTSINDYTFVNCRNLEEIFFSSSIESISDKAFASEEYPVNEKTVFYVPAASYAEQYLKGKGFSVECLGEPPAAQVIYCDDVINKRYGDPDCRLNAAAMTKLRYYSSDSMVASVSEDGYLHIGNAGTADIYIEAEYTKEYMHADKTIKVCVAKASPKLTVPKTLYCKTYGAGAFDLNAASVTPIKYKTSKATVAKVSSEGKVSLVNPGTATITVSSPATANYFSASRKVTVKCSLKNISMKVYALAGKKNKIAWTKVPGADAYQVYVKYPGRSYYKKAVTKGPGVKAVVHKGLEKGKTYKYKVRAYRTVNGKKVYTAFSAVRAVKVRK